MTLALEEFSMALFMHILGWSKGQVEGLLDDVRRDMQDKEIHAYWPM